MLQAVAFDFGGTLFHGEDDVERALDARYRALLDRGYDLERDRYNTLVKETGERFAERYQGDYRRFELGRYSELFFDCWGRQAPEEDLIALDRVFWETRLTHQRLDDDAEPVLSHCRDRGLVIGAITNGNEMMTEHRLETVGEGWFDVVLSSTAIEAEKSTVEPFERFLVETGFEGEECLMVGDRPDEDTWASAVGMKTVLVTGNAAWSVGPEREPDYTIERLSELPPLLDELCQ